MKKKKVKIDYKKLVGLCETLTEMVIRYYYKRVPNEIYNQTIDIANCLKGKNIYPKLIVWNEKGGGKNE